jgi:hypothetical protein
MLIRFSLQSEKSVRYDCRRFGSGRNLIQASGSASADPDGIPRCYVGGVPGWEALSSDSRRSGVGARIRRGLPVDPAARLARMLEMTSGVPYDLRR